MQILAPVGNWSMLTAAVKAGCDAVYFGIKGINMRAGAANFELNEIYKVISYCHNNNVKAYCTVNVIIYEQELGKLNETLLKLKENNIDAIICWDLAVIKKCQELDLEIHLSTQASVSNSQSAKLWKKLGVQRVILARECSLEDVKEIKNKTDLEIEVFVHGARCISYSGRCFMSQELFNKSANRGECLQSCRREYKVTDEEGKEMIMNNNFIMSAKDLCALPILKELTFVDCIKIEGRNRGPDYVSKVVSIYRQALNLIKQDQFTKEKINELTEHLKHVYNKDFSPGFFVDYPHHQRCNVYGNKSTTRKILIGKVNNYYTNISVAEFKIESNKFKIGDKLAFAGSTTGWEEVIIGEIHNDQGNIKTAKKGDIVSVKVNSKVRENDKIYLIRSTPK